MMEAVAPRITMPEPPEVGYELLHQKYLERVADLYDIPIDFHDGQFVDAFYDRLPMRSGTERALTAVTSVLGRRPTAHYVGFKTFPFFHYYNEFFEREDVTFIVLHRRNLDRVFLSWALSMKRDEFGETFDDKLKDFSFAQVAHNREKLTWMMQTLVFNMRVMGDLLARGAIELVVDEQERVQNSERLDEYFGRAVDFSVITHRSHYERLPDMQFFQERFHEMLGACLSKCRRIPALVEQFLERSPAPVPAGRFDTRPAARSLSSDYAARAM
jgi:hypothetical protein